MPVPMALEALRESLRISVDALQRRRASEIPEPLIDRLVELDWLEWHGGSLRLTTTGDNIYRKEVAAWRASTATADSTDDPTAAKETSMAKPNYQFEKRQRELAKKTKKQEKAQRKANPGSDRPEGDGTDNTADNGADNGTSVENADGADTAAQADAPKQAPTAG